MFLLPDTDGARSVNQLAGHCLRHTNSVGTDLHLITPIDPTPYWSNFPEKTEKIYFVEV